MLEAVEAQPPQNPVPQNNREGGPLENRAGWCLLSSLRLNKVEVRMYKECLVGSSEVCLVFAVGKPVSYLSSA